MRFCSSHVLPGGSTDWPDDLELSLPAKPPRAEAPGDLPASSTLRVGAMELGPGRVAPVRKGDAPPALWLTADALPNAVGCWAALADQFPATGLWPLILRPFYDDPARPWGSGELEPVPEAAVDALDVGAVLEEGWHGWLVPINNSWAPGTGPLAPFGPGFPGLAAAQPTAGPVSLAFADGRARVGVVSCRRPADAVALAGWMGTINRISATEVSAVLRSWEDRFGAILVGLDFATMTLLVTRPPMTDDDALRVAAEVAALCPDSLWQPESCWPYRERAATLQALSRQLLGEHVWRLWFD